MAWRVAGGNRFQTGAILMRPRNFWWKKVKSQVTFYFFNNVMNSPILLIDLCLFNPFIFRSSILELKYFNEITHINDREAQNFTQILICVSDNCKFSASSNRRPLEMYSFLLNSTSNLNVWSLLNVVRCRLCRPSFRRLRATDKKWIYDLINIFHDRGFI